ncbi:MAG: alpha/beta hydrolase [Bacteroidetes bacterium QH_7_62_13]|nr:MAG: alpha/beta hydrolase [Bacteroidetes bacterium QH_7_62_13]
MPSATSAPSSLSTDDGLHLFTRSWPSSSPRAVVALVHGYAEHSGRYDHVARTFTEQGATVHAYDQRGHGHSDGRRAYVASFERYLDDLDRFLDHVRAQTPDVPLFLFGHSMGGLVVLKYVLDRNPSPRGLLLSAPAIQINPDLAPLVRRIAQFIGRWFPTLPTTRSPQGAISRDPDVVAEAQNDPLNYHGRVLARTGAEMLRAGRDVQTNLSALDDPFLVIQAVSDDKTIHLYEGLYHETFNEPEQDEVLHDLGTWLDAHVS